MDIFRFPILYVILEKLPPFKIALTPDAKPVKVRLLKYLANQRSFLSAFVESLVRHYMAYTNPT